MVKEIFSFDVLADLRRRQPTYVVYLLGEWDYHIMSWKGCNYQYIKAPQQPIFHDYAGAVAWGKECNKSTKYVDGDGTHADNDVLGIRIVKKNLSMDEWTELRQLSKEFKKLRKDGRYKEMYAVKSFIRMITE